MMKVRSYETFCKIMEVATNDLYRLMFNKAYYEATKRLRIMEALQTEEYYEYLSRWKAERK